MLFHICISPIFAQELNEAVLPELVILVDEQLDLNKKQEAKFLQVLQESYQQLTTIRNSNKSELEKLNMIRLNQQDIDIQLQIIFLMDNISV